MLIAACTLRCSLDTCANKLKNAVRECNAHQEKIEELEAELVEAQNTSATLRRELEEKNVELVREEKKRKLQVDEAMREGREKVEHCQNMMREESKAEMKKLVEEHARSQEILKVQYEEKMIAHSVPSGSRATTSATVSEALLKQKLEQAQTDIAALKEELKVGSDHFALAKLTHHLQTESLPFLLFRKPRRLPPPTPSLRGSTKQPRASGWLESMSSPRILTVTAVHSLHQPAGAAWPRRLLCKANRDR